MPYSCYPVLAEVEFWMNRTICFLCLARLPGVFSHPVFKKLVKFWHVKSFPLHKSGPLGSNERSFRFFGKKSFYLHYE